MAIVKWSDHAMDRVREQARYIAEQSQSKETAWKWANDIFGEVDDALPGRDKLPLPVLAARIQGIIEVLEADKVNPKAFP